MTQRNALSTLATPSRTHAHTTQRVESDPEIEPDSGPRLRAEFQSAVGHVARPTRNFVYVVYLETERMGEGGIWSKYRG